MATPLLIIGLDGATWRLFSPWAREGRLPNLAALMARGTWGPLRSTVPALTLPAWSSFMTGRNPGGHGIYAFQRVAPDRYDSAGLANARDLRAVPFWEVAGRAGRRVGVINVPPSYPLRPVPNGFIVGCMLTPPGAPLTEPPEVARELGEYVIDSPAPKGLRRGDPDYPTRAAAYLADIRRQTDLRAAAALRLMKRRPTDALCVVFYAPDRVQHYFWEYVDPDGDPANAGDPSVRAALLDVYDALDAAVGRLTAEAGPEATVIVVSDHGFTAKPEHAVHVNRWLLEQGLLRRRPLWTLRRKVVRKLFPESWRRRYDTIDHILVDRARTQAWSEALFTGTAGVWVNVRGRYPQGSVAPGVDYEALRTRIIDGLGALRDEQGRAVFRSVQRREDVYRGPFVDRAPDLLAVCEPRFGIVFESLGRELRAPSRFGPFEELGYTGTHEADGIYLFAGPPIAQRGAHDTHPIEMIAPTALHLLDVAVPEDMEAPVCTELLRPEFLESHPVRTGASLGPLEPDATGWQSPDDEARVADHLRALGYLE